MDSLNTLLSDLSEEEYRMIRAWKYLNSTTEYGLKIAWNTYETALARRNEVAAEILNRFSWAYPTADNLSLIVLSGKELV